MYIFDAVLCDVVDLDYMILKDVFNTYYSILCSAMVVFYYETAALNIKNISQCTRVSVLV